MAGDQPASSSLIELAANHYVMAAGSARAGVVVPGGSFQIVNVVSIISTTRATQVPDSWVVPPAPTTRRINLRDLDAQDVLQMTSEMLRQ